MIVKTLSNKYLSCAESWILYLMSREHKVCAIFRGFCVRFVVILVVATVLHFIVVFA